MLTEVLGIHEKSLRSLSFDCTFDESEHALRHY